MKTSEIIDNKIDRLPKEMSSPIMTLLIFSDTVTVWSKLIDAYEHEFMGLVYGQPVDEQSVLQSLLVIADRLKEI